MRPRQRSSSSTQLSRPWRIASAAPAMVGIILFSPLPSCAAWPGGWRHCTLKLPDGQRGAQSKMIKVAILGGSGYTALELIKILVRHPQAKGVAVTSRQEGTPRLDEVHPSLTGLTDLRLENFSADKLLARGVQCVFGCLPHGASMATLPRLLERGVRVIDLSADYRLRDPNVYAQWYGHSHEDLAHLAQAVYGLPELYGDEIPQAQLVANPGCYPQTGILGLAPLVAGKYLEPSSIIIDSKSGVSGAGRTPKLNTHFPECNESVSAYAVGRTGTRRRSS